MSLKDESEPIADDEWIVRRVAADSFREHQQPYVSANAFLPRVKGRQPDEEGISLYRLSCLRGIQPILDFIEVPEKQAITGFVQLRVSEIVELGLSVVKDKDRDLKGHVIIPELCADAWRNAKDRRPRCREWMMDLAKLASRPEAILRDPNKLSNEPLA